MFQSLIARAREARATELEMEGAGESGFTLIELMVVLLIIAILLAIAIPTFLGVTGSAKDRSAQSQLTNVVTETVATYQNSQSYPSSTTSLTSYSSGDPQFTWDDGNASTPTNCAPGGTPGTKCVSVANVDVAGAADSQGVILAVMSSTGTCWYAVNLQAQPISATTFGTDTTGHVQFPLPTTGAQTPGTFYAKSDAGSSAKACDAGAAVSGFSWGTSYGNAPNN